MNVTEESQSIIELRIFKTTRTIAVLITSFCRAETLHKQVLIAPVSRLNKKKKKKVLIMFVKQKQTERAGLLTKINLPF